MRQSLQWRLLATVMPTQSPIWDSVYSPPAELHGKQLAALHSNLLENVHFVNTADD